MKGNAVRSLRFASALLVVIAAGWFLVVHAAKPVAQGFPTDWTHHHVIFSQPANAEQAQRVAQDPRYWQQWYRQKIARTLAVGLDENSAGTVEFHPATKKDNGFWSENMGTGATAGAGNYPAKYSFSITTASCSDYIVFNTGLAGASNQANIIAYNNLYSGCSGGVPSTYWAYNTGGQVVTSPTISGDGTQIAFVQTNAGVGSLVLLKYAASGGVVSTPSSVSNGAYRNCTAPCMTTLTLFNSSSVGIGDTTSSPFPDYTHDIIYVGGASSWLLKFSGVFRGSPAEVMTGGFPLQVNTTTPTALNSPIHDYQSGNVFVTDFGGYLYEVGPTGGVTASAQLDHGAGIVAFPIVDSTAELVYAFSSNDAGTGCAGGPCAAAYIFKVAGFPGTPAEATLGTASVAGGNPLFESDFDSIYQNSLSGDGDMYVCGGTGEDPILYRVALADGAVLNTSTVAPLTPAANHVPCSPVTDVYNPNAPNPNGTQSASEEWVFFGVQSHGHPSNCSATTGCAISVVDLPWLASVPFKVGQEVLVRRANGTLYVSIAIQSGTTGATEPAWPAALGTQTTDNGVIWLNQGTPSATAVAGWAATHTYAARSRILDSNGNVEITVGGGTSGAAGPTWPTKAGAVTTPDGTVSWINAGVWPVASLSSAGGVSAIVYDNVVSAVTEPGASQIYFSTRANQACVTSGGTGGCAIQASQSALK